jgi:hypothetical protein
MGKSPLVCLSVCVGLGPKFAARGASFGFAAEQNCPCRTECSCSCLRMARQTWKGWTTVGLRHLVPGGECLSTCPIGSGAWKTPPSIASSGLLASATCSTTRPQTHHPGRAKTGEDGISLFTTPFALPSPGHPWLLLALSRPAFTVLFAHFRSASASG